MEFLKEIFSYSFAVRALIGGVLLCICASLLGVSLVLKRYSMLGDGLSHVAFGSAAIALSFGVAPLKISIPASIIAAFLLLRLSERGKIKGDAATAVVSSSALAIGIIVATLTTGMNTDINNYMFGSILALSNNDVYIAAMLSLAVIILYILFFNKIFSATFDESFASSCGVRVKFYNGVIAVLTAVTVVIGMRLMGALLISSIIIFPALSAMRVCRRYITSVIGSTVISVLSFVIGLFLSFFYDIPTGAGVVIVNLGFFIVFFIVGRVKSL